MISFSGNELDLRPEACPSLARRKDLGSADFRRADSTREHFPTGESQMMDNLPLMGGATLAAEEPRRSRAQRLSALAMLFVVCGLCARWRTQRPQGSSPAH